MRKVFIIPIIIILVLFSYSCKKTSTSSLNTNNDFPLLEYSAEDSAEAFNIALWFEGNYLPSDSTIRNCLFNINYLRYVLGDSFPVLNNNRFNAPWVIGEILVGFDDTTAILVNNHQYDGWNLLEYHLRPDTILEYPDRLGFALLGFDEPYNPLILSMVYNNLPGVEFSEPNHSGFVGGTFPIFPGLTDGEMSYVFVEHYSYLPRAYYYFKYIENDPYFVGVRDLYNQEDPDWWSEAEKNIQQFSSWHGP